MSEDESVRWEVRKDGAVSGPFDDAQVIAWIQEGRVTATAELRPHGKSSWKTVAITAQRYERFATALASAAEAPREPVALAAPSGGASAVVAPPAAITTMISQTAPVTMAGAPPASFQAAPPQAAPTYVAPTLPGRAPTHQAAPPSQHYGHAPPAQTPSKDALFDFGFKRFVTERIVSMTYIVWFVVCSLGAVLTMLNAVRRLVFEDPYYALEAVGQLVGAPIAAFFSILFCRVLCEFVVVAFRIASELRELRNDLAGGRR